MTRVELAAVLQALQAPVFGWGLRSIACQHDSTATARRLFHGTVILRVETTPSPPLLRSNLPSGLLDIILLQKKVECPNVSRYIDWLLGYQLHCSRMHSNDIKRQFLFHIHTEILKRIRLSVRLSTCPRVLPQKLLIRFGLNLVLHWARQ
jgi:hypothetical protein